MIWRLFKPARYVRAITDLNVVELRERGIEGIILDLDNTLVIRDESEMEESVRAWLEQAQAVGLKLCITTNSDKRARVRAIGEELGLPQVPWASKPRRWGFRQAMALMDTRVQTTAVVGDQLLTDVFGGNRLGLYTIMVQPLSDNDFVTTRLSRLLERWILRRLKMEV